MLNPRLIVQILARNIEKKENPLGIDNSRINTWWKKVSTDREGEWFFFTGMLYQITPYIETAVRYLQRLENSRLQNILHVSKILSPFSLIGTLTPAELKAEANRILANIYRILKTSENGVFYRPELDTYSGILLHDLGNERAFERHALKVVKRLKMAGVERIVTPDPHTAYALKSLYPMYADFDLEVKSYLELIESVRTNSEETFVIHDPCYYGRYLGISERVRDVLDRSGIKYHDVKYSKNITSCCGGPVEAISPLISSKIAELRLEELGESEILTFCPICLANLRRAGGNVRDFAEVIEGEND